MGAHPRASPGPCAQPSAEVLATSLPAIPVCRCLYRLCRPGRWGVAVWCGADIRLCAGSGIVGTPVVVLDSEREAAIALAHENSPEHRSGSSGTTALGQPLLGELPEGNHEERFNFMPPSNSTTENGQAGGVREGIWVEGGSSGPTQVSTRALPPRGSSGAVAAADARIAHAEACASGEPARISAAMQAWHEAAVRQSPPPEQLPHANDSASERERHRCV